MEIEHKTIEISSASGHPAVYTYQRHTDPVDRLVVAFPGMAYSMDAPIMWYTSLAATENGFDVLGLEYSFQVRGNPGFNSDIETVVKEVSTGLKAFFSEHKYRKIVFAAKSIGTVIGPKVSEKLGIVPDGFIFLTPLQRMLDYMNGTRKMLAVIGDRDPAFPVSVVEKLRDQQSVMLVPDADHSLEVPGEPVVSASIMKELVERTISFLKEIK